MLEKRLVNLSATKDLRQVGAGFFKPLLSYVDNEDNQKFLVETDDTEILLQNMKQYQRDYKIDEILE